MANITADYNRGFNTRVDPKAASVIPPLTARDQLQGIIDTEPRGGAMPPMFRMPTSRPSGMRSTKGTIRRLPSQKRVDPLAGQKQADQYEGTLKSASMRPVGVGPGSIPGMGVDTQKLPSRLLPSGASMMASADPMSAGDSSRRSQAQDQALQSQQMDLRRQQMLLSALQDQQDYLGF